MVEAFMSRHKNIRVEIDERFTENYNNAKDADSAGGTLPNVFMYANFPQANSNDWCADLSSLAQSDGEWNNILKPIREAATVLGITVAIPYAIYFYGYFNNQNLFDSRKVPVPAVGFSVDTIRSAIAAMTNVHGRNIVSAACSTRRLPVSGISGTL